MPYLTNLLIVIFFFLLCFAIGTLVFWLILYVLAIFRLIPVESEDLEFNKIFAPDTFSKVFKNLVRAFSRQKG